MIMKTQENNDNYSISNKMKMVVINIVITIEKEL